jgi:galactonate dehydratase
MVRTLELVETHVSSRTQWHFVLLRDDDLTAVGECSDSGDPTLLAKELAALEATLLHRDLVADRAPLMQALECRIDEATSAEAFVVATLMGGLEQMLTDYAAQAAEVPVWKWLGGSPPDPVPVYANINRMPGGRTPEDVAHMAARAVAAGFTAVKCAPFDVSAPDQDLTTIGLARLRAIRAAVGDDVELKVDCHERVPVEELHAILPQLEELGITWLEDVVSLQDVEALRQLRAATTLPIAGGETMFSPDEALPAASEGLIDILMPDVKHAGGIAGVLAVARAVPELAVSPHNPSGPVATAASAHLFAVCPNATVLEYQFGEIPWRSGLVGGLERVTEGRLHVDDRPGLGVTLPNSHPSFRVLWSTMI